VTTCPTCHGKDSLHGLDCGFTSGRPHITHHDDCGCLTALYQARIAALDAENERLKDGMVRIVQCHAYMMTIVAEDVETGEVGPHVVDGNDCSDILTIVCDVFPDFSRWAERGAP